MNAYMRDRDAFNYIYLMRSWEQDELEAELENLDEELLSPATTMPTAPVLLSSTRQAAQPPKNKTDDEELATLQAELAN